MVGIIIDITNNATSITLFMTCLFFKQVARYVNIMVKSRKKNNNTEPGVPLILNYRAG